MAGSKGYKSLFFDETPRPHPRKREPLSKLREGVLKLFKNYPSTYPNFSFISLITSVPLKLGRY
jgi:hypothetical protein